MAKDWVEGACTEV